MATKNRHTNRHSTNGAASRRTLVGATAATALAAAAGTAFLVANRARGKRSDPPISDAPAWTMRHARTETGEALVGRTVTIGRPRRDLYDFWRELSNLPAFMDNVRAVEVIDKTRSRWTIAAPGGGDATIVSRIVEDRPGELIAWESEDGSDVRHSGRIEFIDGPPGRGTMVRATIAYRPPGGAAGRTVAKLMQREPGVQARRDLRRFKQLMETGEVTSSASPSGRPSEKPTEQYL